jgi:xylan 1,4-beta-xylosidase
MNEATIDLKAKAATCTRCSIIFWKALVGSGHAYLGLRKDWQAQLAAVHCDIGTTGVRFHGLFDDDIVVVLP